MTDWFWFVSAAGGDGAGGVGAGVMSSPPRSEIGEGEGTVGDGMSSPPRFEIWEGEGMEGEGCGAAVTGAGAEVPPPRPEADRGGAGFGAERERVTARAEWCVWCVPAFIWSFGFCLADRMVGEVRG